MSERNLVVDREEMYRLFQDEGGLGLGVLSGGIGMYEIKIRLNEEERRAYEEQGRGFLEELSKEVRRERENFRNRWIT